MNTIATKSRALLAGLLLTFLASAPATLLASSKTDRNPHFSTAEGQLDWSIVPPALSPEYATFGDDGSLTLHDMPLAGNFSLVSEGLQLNATAWAILGADLDPAFNGPIYGPFSVTAVIDGEAVLIFSGQFSGKSVGLLSSGEMVAQGRGPLAGMALFLEFVETGANTETFTLTGYVFDPHSR